MNFESLIFKAILNFRSILEVLVKGFERPYALKVTLWYNLSKHQKYKYKEPRNTAV